MEVRHFATNSHGAEGCFSADIGVGRGNDCFDFWEQISGHFDTGDVAECAESKADDILVVVVQIAGNRLASWFI